MEHVYTHFILSSVGFLLLLKVECAGLQIKIAMTPTKQGFAPRHNPPFSTYENGWWFAEVSLYCGCLQETESEHSGDPAFNTSGYLAALGSQQHWWHICALCPISK
jgi:hypothetical protein